MNLASNSLQLSYDSANVQGYGYPTADWEYDANSPLGNPYAYPLYSPSLLAPPPSTSSFFVPHQRPHPPSTDSALPPDTPPSPLHSRTASSSSTLTIAELLNVIPPSVKLSPPIPVSPPANGPQSAQLPFIAKLRNLLAHEDRNCDVLRWDETGTAFLVAHTNPRFKNEVLPTNYGHNNYASFTRQLNIYGFSRLTPEALSSLLAPSVRLEGYHGWRHPSFTRADIGGLAGQMRPRPSQARRREKEENLRRGGRKV